MVWRIKFPVRPSLYAEQKSAPMATVARLTLMSSGFISTRLMSVTSTPLSALSLTGSPTSPTDGSDAEYVRRRQDLSLGGRLTYQIYTVVIMQTNQVCYS